jgi:hypothetical protein
MVVRIFWILFLLIVSIPYGTRAQRAEVGFGVGTFTYTGDLARNYRFSNSRFAGTAFYRNCG